MSAINPQKAALARCAVAMTLLAGSALAQDFNGDGIADIAIGTPGEDIGGMADAGAVTIIYGAGAGLGLQALGPLPAAQITQATFGLDPVEAGDAFGASLAWGDFDGDPFDDLAIGSPGEDHPISGAVDAGMVIVLYGSPGGLLPLNPPLWVQDPPILTPSLGDLAEAADDLGRALASGDFNADGFDDLAIGVPGEDDPTGTVDIGIVHVLYGTPMGVMVGPGVPVVWQGGWPWADASETGDRFGSALAAGDMDGDGTADLAIGVPFEDFAGKADAGMVNIAYGFPGPGILPGLGLAERWTQASPGVPEACDVGDRFGAALAIGNFDGVLAEDLAIGVPLEDIGIVPAADTGCVNVIYSAGLGLGLEGLSPPAPQAAEIWHQGIAGIPEINDTGDMFGSALGAGDFNTDGFEDLAVGVPGEDVGAGPVVDAGSVYAIYGAPPPLGLDAFFVPAQVWGQQSIGVPDGCETGDGLGSALTVGDYDANLAMDLAIGVPSEDFGAFPGAGCVNTVYGNPGIGLNGAGAVPAELWHQNVAGVPDANETGDGFGSALDNDD